jgi:glutamyl-tRNA(Gln) amidotransferase subunit D
MAKPGDIVEIEYDGKKAEGRLMPRVGMLDKNVTVLKLENGYNIGIKNSRIKKISVNKEFCEQPQKKQEIKQDKSLPNVSVLSFGGTISSKIDYRTGGVYADYTAEDFIRMCPELADKANIRAKKVMSVMSEDIDWKDWEH